MNIYHTLPILTTLYSTSMFCMDTQMPSMQKNETQQEQKAIAISSLYKMSYDFLKEYKKNEKNLVHYSTLYSLHTLIETFITEKNKHNIETKTLIDYALLKQYINNPSIAPAHIALFFQKLNDYKQSCPQKKDLNQLLQNQYFDQYLEEIYYAYQLELDAKSLNLPITFTQIASKFTLLKEQPLFNTNITSFVKFYLCIQELINLDSESAEFLTNLCSTVNRQKIEKK